MCNVSNPRSAIEVVGKRQGDSLLKIWAVRKRKKWLDGNIGGQARTYEISYQGIFSGEDICRWDQRGGGKENTRSPMTERLDTGKLRGGGGGGKARGRGVGKSSQ